MIDSLAVVVALAGLAFVVWRIVTLERNKVIEGRKARPPPGSGGSAARGFRRNP